MRGDGEEGAEGAHGAHFQEEVQSLGYKVGLLHGGHADDSQTAANLLHCSLPGPSLYIKQQSSLNQPSRLHFYAT